MKKWDYKLIKQAVKAKNVLQTDNDIDLEALEEQFQILGDEGWEYYECQRIDTGGYTDKIIFIFRKLKE